MTDEERKALEKRYEDLRRKAEERGVFVKAKAIHQSLRKKHSR